MSGKLLLQSKIGRNLSQWWIKWSPLSVPFALLIYCGFFPIEPNHHKHQMMNCIQVFFLWYGFEISKRMHWYPGLLMAFFGTSATYWAFNKNPPYAGLGIVINLVFDTASAREIIQLIAGTLPFVFMTKEDVKYWFLGFQWISLASAFYMIVSLFVGHPAVGVLSNPGMDSMLVGGFLPILYHHLKGWHRRLIWLNILALLASGSSTAYGLVCLFALYWVWVNLNKLWLFLPAILAIPFGWFLLKDDLFRPSGREGVFMETWVKYLEDKNYWFGSGIGSFITFLPPLQITKYHQRDIFIFAHDEAIQVLYEQGIIGLLAIISLYLFLLWRARHRPWMVTTLFAFGMISLLQMPFRIVFVAMFFTLICRIIFDASKDDCLHNRVSNIS